MRSILAAALGISSLCLPVFPQSARNPRGSGYRTIVVAPLAGAGTAADPRGPAFLRGGGR